MSEQEIREGMLLAVWDEPPLDFDPDTLMRRVEQKKSRRRALVGVGVATAMIVVVSLALPSLLPRGNEGQLASEGQTSSSAPSAEPTEKKAQRIGDKLAERLRTRLTNSRDIFGSLQPGQFNYPPYSTTAQRGQPDDAEFSGYVYLTDEIGPTALRVLVMKGEFNSKSFCAAATLCQNIAQKDGSIVSEAEYLDDTPDVQRAEVVRRFESGYLVQISSYAYNPSNGVGRRQTVPVRVGVLTELVTDPSISWE